jgi:hypothetical protein
MQSATQTAPVSKKTLWAGRARVGDPLFSHILFPVYMGLFVWGGLYFRDERVRALIPFRS